MIEQHRHVELLLELLEQFQDLRLDGHVERGRGLVGDQKVRFVGERHGDHDTLALAAGKLVRIGREPFFRFLDADLAQQLDHPFTGRAFGQAAMNFQDFADLLLDGVQRIERCHRLLENHRNVVAADGPQGLALAMQQILVLEGDLA